VGAGDNGFPAVFWAVQRGGVADVVCIGCGGLRGDVGLLWLCGGLRGDECLLCLSNWVWSAIGRVCVSWSKVTCDA